MLVITQGILDAFPKWKKAGWEVGDKFDVILYLAAHPPKRPPGIKK